MWPVSVMATASAPISSLIISQMMRSDWGLMLRKYGSVLLAISSASLDCFAAIRSFSPSTL
ncbi:hypothetical protein D3C74_413680 [compost metagenome]